MGAHQQLTRLLLANVAEEPAQLATPGQMLDIGSVWESIQQEVSSLVETEPESGGLLHHGVTIHDSLQSAMAFVLSNKLATSTLSPAHLIRLISSAYEVGGQHSLLCSCMHSCISCCRRQAHREVWVGSGLVAMTSSLLCQHSR